MSNKSTIVRFIQASAPRFSRWAPGLAARALAALFTSPRSRPVSRHDLPAMAEAERSRLPFDAQRSLAVYTWGSGGPAVLLVHGWAGRASQLSGYARGLVERGYRVVAFDAPAHGESDGRRSALPEVALAVQRVAEAHGPFEAVLGHSMGTAATTLALSRGVAARRLVYLAPPEDLAGYLTRLGRSLRFSPAVAARAQALLERRYGVPFDQARGRILAPRMRPSLHVFHDPADPDVPFAEGLALTRAWPGATLEVTEGLGHHRVLWDSEVRAAALDHLAPPQSKRAPPEAASGSSPRSATWGATTHTITFARESEGFKTHARGPARL